jgi:DNA topoisomerase-1
VSDGKLGWKEFLRDFWKDFNTAIKDVGELRITHVIDALNEVLEPHIFPAKTDAEGNAVNPRVCPLCGNGQLSLKLGKFGSFIGCSNYPECRYTRPFGAEKKDDSDIPPEGKVLGQDPVTDLAVTLKNGRFGAYVQLGPDPVDKGDKPKRSSIPPAWPLAELTFEQALKLLSLPREVGKHPEDGEPIMANLGRYGPYVQHLKTYANVPDVTELFEIGLNRAVDLIAQKRAGGGMRRGQTPPLKELGNHTDGEPIRLYAGRFGPYLKHGAVNANIPKGADPNTVTLEQAIEIVNARALAAPSPKGRRGAKAKKAPAPKKAPAAKAEKKPAAKKAAAKSGDAPAAKKKAAPKAAKKAAKAPAE